MKRQKCSFQFHSCSGVHRNILKLRTEANWIDSGDLLSIFVQLVLKFIIDTCICDRCRCFSGFSMLAETSALHSQSHLTQSNAIQFQVSFMKRRFTQLLGQFMLHIFLPHIFFTLSFSILSQYLYISRCTLDFACKNDLLSQVCNNRYNCSVKLHHQCDI